MSDSKSEEDKSVRSIRIHIAFPGFGTLYNRQQSLLKIMHVSLISFI